MQKTYDILRKAKFVRRIPLKEVGQAHPFFSDLNQSLPLFHGLCSTEDAGIFLTSNIGTTRSVNNELYFHHDKDFVG